MALFSTEEWVFAADIVDEALDLPPDERSFFLARACGGDAVLRGKIEEFLRATDAASGALLMPAIHVAASESADFTRGAAQVAVGRRVGPYRLLKPIGEGGMGTVYLAERADEQYRKHVAVKLVRYGLSARNLHRRFRYERQILASLDHPNIARLLDGGVGEDGPYLVMEYVDGKPIDEYCAESGVGLEGRLRLFAQVCEAVQYAHRNLVVHRDLKPSNVLVSDDGAVKLLDFGIAKLLETGVADEDPLTHTGVRLMTPEYASPEQIRGEAVTTATDVYALGVILFELLVGSRPFSLRGKSASEIERVVCTVAPPRPSTAARGSSFDPGTRGAGGRTRVFRMPDRNRHSRMLRGDIDTIVLKALQKEPERRYASVEALLDDLRRYESGLPVKARPDSLVYRGSKFVRRHRIGAAAVAAFLLLAAWAGVQERSLRAEAEAEAHRAESVKNFLLSVFEEANPYRQNDETDEPLTARELLDRGAERVEWELTNEPALQSEMLGILGGLYWNIGVYDQAEPLLVQSLARRKRLFGEPSAPVAAAYHDLGKLYRARSRYEEAERYLRTALQMRTRVLGPRDPAVVESMNTLGYLLQESARLDEAEPLFRAALEIRLRSFGNNDARVGESLNNVALLLFWKGRYAEAEPLYRESLRIRELEFGPDDLVYAETAHNLAQVLQLLEEPEESENLYARALEVKRRRFPGPHPSVSVHLNNYGRLLLDRGRMDEAEALFREALEMDVALFGEKHPYVAACLENLVQVLRFRGELTEAESMARRALDINRSLLGEDHTHAALAHNTLASVLTELGRFEEARHAYHRALAIYRDRMGEDHLYVALVTVNMARSVHDSGRIDEADSLYADAIRRLEPVQPQGRARFAYALVGRGQLLVDRGSAQEAQGIIERGIALLEAQYGVEDWRVAEARITLGNCLAALGRTEEARTILAGSAETLRKVRGTENRLTRMAAAALARMSPT